MVFTGKELLPYVHGAVDYEETENGIILYRFAKGFRKRLSQSVSYAACGAGISLVFRTDAKQLHISFTLKDAVSCENIPPAIDLLLNDELLFHHPIPAQREMKNDLTFALANGVKTVRLWLPHQAVLAIEFVELEGAACCDAVERGKRCMLALADSITQGFYCDAPSLTYWNRLAKKLGTEALNQGIGGYSFSPETVMKTAFEPHFILVMLGTNDYFNADKSDIPGFFRAVRTAYPAVPILAVSPIVRLDAEIAATQIAEIKNAIRRELKSANGDQLIDGQKLLPADGTLFEDGLHPNREGMKLLEVRLAEKIRQTGILERI